MSRCTSCNAEIVFAKTEAGKTMPVSMASGQKRIVLEHDADGTVLARVVSTYLSHFADCPNAPQHRKPRTP